MCTISGSYWICKLNVCAFQFVFFAHVCIRFFYPTEKMCVRMHFQCLKPERIHTCTSSCNACDTLNVYLNRLNFALFTFELTQTEDAHSHNGSVWKKCAFNGKDHSMKMDRKTKKTLKRRDKKREMEANNRTLCVCHSSV